MSTNKSKARKRRKMRRMLQKLIPAVIAVVLIILVVIVSMVTGLFENFSYSSEQIDESDLYSYYGVVSEDYAAIVENGVISEQQLRVIDGRCYLDLASVKSEFTDRFYYDVNGGALLYTTEESVLSAAIGAASYSIAGIETQTPYAICMLEGDTLYVALDYVSLYTTLSYEVFGGNGEPYRVAIRTAGGTVQKAELQKSHAVRLEADKKSKIIKELDEGTTVTVLETSGDWSKVQTDDLLIGFIETRDLTDTHEKALEAPAEVVEGEFKHISKDYPIVLAWDMVTNADANNYLSDRLQSVSGLTTISPTWFSLADNNGTVASIASQAYVDTAHAAGYEVWGLVDDLTYPEVSTYEVLSYSDKRAFVIEQLINYAKQYGLEGINVDFESISVDTGEPFIQFIRELSIECRKEGIVLSVDNYVPTYTSHYNRKEQGIFADYVIIMGYDEHIKSSEKSGSVASLNFVTSGIEMTLEEVPAERVINAVPLYTRIWIETPKTEAEIAAEDANTEYIPYKLDVQTVRMADAIAAVRNAGVTAEWDETTAQNYAEWTKEGSIYKVWLEDAQSLGAKLQVMVNKNLAGAAAWQLGYADSSVWEVLDQYY